VIKATFIILHKNKTFFMILVLTDKVSPAIHYVLEEVFSRHFQVEFEITNNQEHYQSATNTLKIKYTPLNDSELEGLWIPNSEFLNRNLNEINDVNLISKIDWIPMKKVEIIDSTFMEMLNLLNLKNENFKLHEHYSLRPVYFSMKSELGFDVFSHVFVLLSNIEEIILSKDSENLDKYKRIKSNKLSFVKNQMHLLPMVEIAIDRLKEFLKLETKQEREFQIIPTADIDQCFRFKGKPLYQILGGAIKYPKTLANRISSLFSKTDSFTPSETVQSILSENPNSKIFWLCNRKQSKLNKQAKRSNVEFQNEILQSVKYSEIGIHPSYQLSKEIEIYSEEKNWLSNISEQKIANSRQHYIQLTLPKTYQILEKMNIENDWSMGFNDNIGYRTGTSLPYFWFDISTNEKTNLIINPFVIMDVSCKNYLKINSFQSNQLGELFKQSIKQYQGNFCFIFHNESVSETDGWEGWKNTIETWASHI
jgi:hypothetical protein